MGVERVRCWQAPAELPSTDVVPPYQHRSACDCFWHRRVFTHLSRGPADEDKLPLARRVTRTDWPGGRISWEIEMRVESTLLVARRSLVPHTTRPEFQAWAEVGGAQAVELVRTNPQHRSRQGLGADPTLIFVLPNGAGRLVVWREAWWWRLVDGVDPITIARAM